MGKTAMPIIWFFTKISSVASERLNTPVLNIAVHLEFHSNKKYFLSKSVDIIIKDWYIDNSTEENGVKLWEKSCKKYKKVLDNRR